MVFRATFPAEGQGKKDLCLIRARDELLAAQGEMTLAGLLERRINRIPWADKLMEPESKGSGVRLRMFLAVVPGKQPIADHALTRALFDAGQPAQFPSDSSFPDDWPGFAAQQASTLGLATKTQPVLQPAGQR